MDVDGEAIGFPFGCILFLYCLLALVLYWLSAPSETLFVQNVEITYVDHRVTDLP